MTNKERLATILNGGIPDYPPHFEIDFHLGKEMFGLDVDGARDKAYASEAQRRDTHLKLHIEQQLRLVEELGYATATFAAHYPPEIGVTEVKKAIGERALVCIHEWDGVFWMPSGADFMGFVERMFERPDEMLAEARRKCDGAKQLLTKYADAGADFFLLAYDFGFNSGPFISPQQFAQFVVPFLTEIVQAAHDLGKKAILHSDGDLNELLDLIHGTGIDGYQSVDPQGHMDIKAVREKYPDWILMGNVNCSMMQDTIEDKIRESVRYCMKYGGMGKRYIFSTSNCIFPGMPVESYRIMRDEYNRLCCK